MTTTHTVFMNGRSSLAFKPTRCLHQGDPLSPFLFLICSERLFSLTCLALAEGKLMGVRVSHSGPVISHLLFIDDFILYGKASMSTVRILKDILKEYEDCLGQCVNFSKSSIFFSRNTMEAIWVSLSLDLQMRYSNDRERYLGLLNIVGRKNRFLFNT